MGLVADVFPNIVDFERLEKRASGSYGRHDMVEIRTTDDDGTVKSIPVNRLALAKLERALRDSYMSGNVFNPDAIIAEYGNDIYEQMIDTDGHLFAGVEDLCGGAAHMPAQILPWDETNVDMREHAEFIEAVFDRFSLYDSLTQVYYARPLGFSLSEKILSEPFTFKNKSKIGIKAIERLPMDQVIINVLDKPKVITSRSPEGVIAASSKFVFMRCGGGYYGDPLLRKAFKAWFYKQNSFRWIARFIERYGNPPLIAFHDTDDEAAQNMKMLEAIISDSIASLPKSAENMKVLEPQRDPSSEWFLRYCDDEMSKVLLSGTRQSSGSADAGAYSATEVHQDNKNDRITNLAKRGVSVINQQIIKPLIDREYGPQKYYPYYSLGIKEEETPKDYLEKLTGLKNAGISISVSRTEVYEKLQLKKPDPDDAIDIEAGGGLPFTNFTNRDSVKNLPSFPRTNSNEPSNSRSSLTMSGGRKWEEQKPS